VCCLIVIQYYSVKAMKLQKSENKGRTVKSRKPEGTHFVLVLKHWSNLLSIYLIGMKRRKITKKECFCFYSLKLKK